MVFLSLRQRLERLTGIVLASKESNTLRINLFHAISLISGEKSTIGSTFGHKIVLAIQVSIRSLDTVSHVP